MSTDLRLGRWQDVLADVGECDALITDIPYGPRTIAGHRSGHVGCGDGPGASRIKYAPMDEENTRVFFTRWQGAVAHWMAIFCDHTQWFWMEDQAKSIGKKGMMTFMPIPWVKSDGGTPRFTCDGPGASSEWLFIARHRRRVRDLVYRPGHYDHPTNHLNQSQGVTGSKPIALMRAIIRDYTRPGDLIVDPCAGGGTTLLAAAIEGRRAIGAEMDVDTFAKAKARLERGYTPEMFS